MEVCGLERFLDSNSDKVPPEAGCMISNQWKIVACERTIRIQEGVLFLGEKNGQVFISNLLM